MSLFPLHRFRIALALVAGSWAFTDARAETLDYVLDLPAGQLVSYKIEFQVDHPGTIAIEADWSPRRVVSLRVQGPDGRHTTRRTGPPPHRLQLEVPVEAAGDARVWVLSIRGLPAREAARGGLSLSLPDVVASPPADDPRPPSRHPPSEPLEAWMLPRTVPDGLPADWARLYRSTEALRQAVVERQARDRYAWQEPMLRYLVSLRDGRSDLPEPQTARLLQRSARAVRRVERLAASDDPLIVGPPPESGYRRRAWLTLRQDRIDPLEHELDRILHAVHRGDAPELSRAPWFPRFLTCVIACERHFEQRGRLGDEAANAAVVEEQWERILMAADALEQLAKLAGLDDD